MQLVVEETEGRKWVVTATRDGRAGWVRGAGGQQRQGLNRGSPWGLAMDLCGIPWLWASSKESVLWEYNWGFKNTQIRRV